MRSVVCVVPRCLIHRFHCSKNECLRDGSRIYKGGGGGGLTQDTNLLGGKHTGTRGSGGMPPPREIIEQ